MKLLSTHKLPGAKFVRYLTGKEQPAKASEAASASSAAEPARAPYATRSAAFVGSIKEYGQWAASRTVKAPCVHLAVSACMAPWTTPLVRNVLWTAASSFNPPYTPSGPRTYDGMPAEDLPYEADAIRAALGSSAEFGVACITGYLVCMTTGYAAGALIGAAVGLIRPLQPPAAVAVSAAD